MPPVPVGTATIVRSLADFSAAWGLDGKSSGEARSNRRKDLDAGLLEQDLRFHDPARAPAHPLRFGRRGALAGDGHRLRGAAGRPRLHPAARRGHGEDRLRAGAHQGSPRVPAAERGAGLADDGRAGDARPRGAVDLRRALRSAPRRRRFDPHPPDPRRDVHAAVVGREDHRRLSGRHAVPCRNIQRAGSRSARPPSPTTRRWRWSGCATPRRSSSSAWCAAASSATTRRR